jgi:hypothetical protein
VPGSHSDLPAAPGDPLLLGGPTVRLTGDGPEFLALVSQSHDRRLEAVWRSLIMLALALNAWGLLAWKPARALARACGPEQLLLLGVSGWLLLGASWFWLGVGLLGFLLRLGQVLAWLTRRPVPAAPSSVAAGS